MAANEIKTIGIVGSGAMGAGIAQIALTNGFEVILHDMNAEALQKAADEIQSRLARLVEKGKAEADLPERAAAALTLASDIEAFSRADIVIEAIVEKIEPKQELFKKLEAIVPEHALLASNTSSLSIAAIASACERPERIFGYHFFNPVPLMKLVEVIHAPATDPAVIDAAMDLSRRLGKTAVKVKDGPGFLVNLGGRAYVTEALHAQAEGVADFETIDRIMRDAIGFRMGPFELLDLTGLDVNFPANSAIWGGYMYDPRVKTTPLHQNLFNARRLGRKTGQGFYKYPEAAAPREAYEPPADDGEYFIEAVIGDSDPRLSALPGVTAIEDDGVAPILVAPQGEDAATIAMRLDLDPERVVAVDLTGLERKFITLMAPLTGNGVIENVEAWLHARGHSVAVIKDSPGFIAQRLLAMIANLGCEMAQIGVGTPEDIDLGMKLGQNYPYGPLELAAGLGPMTVVETLMNLQGITGSDRYRPSLWLRRRAMLGADIYTPD